MKLFLSSLTFDVFQGLPQEVPEDRPNILLSYGVIKNDDYLIMDKHRHLVDSLILDSGTFSLHFSGDNETKGISLEGYAEYLRICGDKFDFYFNFDRNFTIDDFEESLHYLNSLRKLGFSPVPVIHDYYRKEIDHYAAEGFKLVALGSVMEEDKPTFLRKQFDIDQAVNRLMEKGVNVHVFAAATYDQLAHIPVYSCDASSWVQNAAAGKILYWNPASEKEDKTELIRFKDRPNLKEDGNYFFKDYPFRKELESHLETIGLTYSDLMGENYTKNRMIVNARYYIQLQKIISDRHKELGFTY